jgi:hypothetical protein
MKISSTAIGSTIIKPGGGALLVFELPAPDDPVSRRQLHIGADVRLGFLDIANQIAARNERLHSAKREPFSCSSFTGPAMCARPSPHRCPTNCPEGLR